MEGVRAEAASLAGHLRLGKLIVLYDNNHVTLSARHRSRSPRTSRARYRAYGWHVDRRRRRQRPGGDRARDCARAGRDATAVADLGAHAARLRLARQAGHVRGARLPLGADEVAQDEAEPRLAASSRRSTFRPRRSAHFRERDRARPRAPKTAGTRRFDALCARRSPSSRARSQRRFARRAARRLGRATLPAFAADAKGMATRKASEAGDAGDRAHACPSCRRLGRSRSVDVHLAEGGRRLRIAAAVAARRRAGLVGGGWGYAGRNIHFGVREHAMGAAVNGLASHGGFIPFGATFLIFSDYMRPADPAGGAGRAARRSSSSRTTASALGEDGPTPPAHRAARVAARDSATSLVIRPCDANETRVGVAGRAASTRDRPVRAGADAPGRADARPRRASRAPAACARGAYVLDRDAPTTRDAATSS